MIRRPSLPVSIALCLALVLGAAATSFAQTADDDDAKLRPLEPDFTVVNLPTTLPLPVHGGEFFLTHRFGGDFRREDFGQLAGNLFGLDEGATIDFGYRFGVAKHLEAAVSRTSAFKAFEFQAKYDAFHQDQGRPVGLSAIVSVEGENNFRENYAPAIGLSISRTLGTAAAVYVDPFWIHNSGAITGATRDTGFVGLGARVQLMRDTFVVAEVSPRIGGYAPGDALYAFGIEKRVGGHVFQLNFGDSTEGATYGQIARGGSPSIFMGFNLSRKFY